MRHILIVIIFLSVSNIAFAQNAKLKHNSDTAYLIIADSFFYKLPNSVDDALDYIFKTNPWTKTATENINSMKVSFKATLKLIGNYTGTELINMKSLGSNFVLCSYLVKYQRQPLRINIIFYRPENTWLLYNLKYDDKLSSELEKAASFDSHSD